MNVTKTSLGGHSGCKIILVEIESGINYVKKISSSTDYNERLILQCKKQKNFSSLYLKTPTIYEEGYDENGLFYFDMEYIQGITLCEYLKSLEVSKIKSIVQAIAKHELHSNVNTCYNTEAVFMQKISELSRQLNVVENSVLADSLELLNNYNWENFCNTDCHGDLTMENIIVHNDDLYLIDFLDSFYDSWILDAATLLQDCLCQWSYRYEKDISTNTKIRLMIFRDVLLDEICNNDDQKYKNIYYSLILKLIRIYPYTTDATTQNFLDDKLKTLVKYVKERW